MPSARRRKTTRKNNGEGWRMTSNPCTTSSPASNHKCFTSILTTRMVGSAEELFAVGKMAAQSMGNKKIVTKLGLITCHENAFETPLRGACGNVGETFGRFGFASSRRKKEQKRRKRKNDFLTSSVRTIHTRDQKARETKSEKEIACVQSRRFIHGKDLSSTIHQPWLFNVRKFSSARFERGGKCCATCAQHCFRGLLSQSLM